MQTKQRETRTMSASDVRSNWSEVVEDVHREGGRVIVERSGIPVVAVVSIEELRLLDRVWAARREQFRVIEEIWETFADVPQEELEREVEKAVAEARAELRAERMQS
jgi:prevent-host-death family protein